MAPSILHQHGHLPGEDGGEENQEAQQHQHPLQQQPHQQKQRSPPLGPKKAKATQSSLSSPTSKNPQAAGNVPQVQTPAPLPPPPPAAQVAQQQQQQQKSVYGHGQSQAQLQQQQQQHNSNSNNSPPSSAPRGPSSKGRFLSARAAGNNIAGGAGHGHGHGNMHNHKLMQRPQPQPAAPTTTATTPTPTPTPTTPPTTSASTNQAPHTPTTASSPPPKHPQPQPPHPHPHPPQPKQTVGTPRERPSKWNVLCKNTVPTNLTYPPPTSTLTNPELCTRGNACYYGHHGDVFYDGFQTAAMEFNSKGRAVERPPPEAYGVGILDRAGGGGKAGGTLSGQGVGGGGAATGVGVKQNHNSQHTQQRGGGGWMDKRQQWRESQAMAIAMNQHQQSQQSQQQQEQGGKRMLALEDERLVALKNHNNGNRNKGMGMSNNHNSNNDNNVSVNADSMGSLSSLSSSVPVPASIPTQPRRMRMMGNTMGGGGEVKKNSSGSGSVSAGMEKGSGWQFYTQTPRIDQRRPQGEMMSEEEETLQQQQQQSISKQPHQQPQLLQQHLPTPNANANENEKPPPQPPTLAQDSVEFERGLRRLSLDLRGGAGGRGSKFSNSRITPVPRITTTPTTRTRKHTTNTDGDEGEQEGQQEQGDAGDDGDGDDESSNESSSSSSVEFIIPPCPRGPPNRPGGVVGGVGGGGVGGGCGVSGYPHPHPLPPQPQPQQQAQQQQQQQQQQPGSPQAGTTTTVPTTADTNTTPPSTTPPPSPIITTSPSPHDSNTFILDTVNNNNHHVSAEEEEDTPNPNTSSPSFASFAFDPSAATFIPRAVPPAPAADAPESVLFAPEVVAHPGVVRMLSPATGRGVVGEGDVATTTATALPPLLHPPTTVTETVFQQHPVVVDGSNFTSSTRGHGHGRRPSSQGRRGGGGSISNTNTNTNSIINNNDSTTTTTSAQHSRRGSHASTHSHAWSQYRLSGSGSTGSIGGSSSNADTANSPSTTSLSLWNRQQTLHGQNGQYHYQQQYTSPSTDPTTPVSTSGAGSSPVEGGSGRGGQQQQYQYQYQYQYQPLSHYPPHFRDDTWAAYSEARDGTGDVGVPIDDEKQFPPLRAGDIIPPDGPTVVDGVDTDTRSRSKARGHPIVPIGIPIPSSRAASPSQSSAEFQVYTWNNYPHQQQQQQHQEGTEEMPSHRRHHHHRAAQSMSANAGPSASTHIQPPQTDTPMLEKIYAQLALHADCPNNRDTHNLLRRLIITTTETDTVHEEKTDGNGITSANTNPNTIKASFQRLFHETTRLEVSVVEGFRAEMWSVLGWLTGAGAEVGRRRGSRDFSETGSVGGENAVAVVGGLRGGGASETASGSGAGNKPAPVMLNMSILASMFGGNDTPVSAVPSDTVMLNMSSLAAMFGGNDTPVSAVPSDTTTAISSTTTTTTTTTGFPPPSSALPTSPASASSSRTGAFIPIQVPTNHEGGRNTHPTPPDDVDHNAKIIRLFTSPRMELYLERSYDLALRIQVAISVMWGRVGRVFEREWCDFGVDGIVAEGEIGRAGRRAVVAKAVSRVVAALEENVLLLDDDGAVQALERGAAGETPIPKSALWDRRGLCLEAEPVALSEDGGYFCRLVERLCIDVVMAYDGENNRRNSTTGTSDTLGRDRIATECKVNGPELPSPPDLPMFGEIFYCRKNNSGRKREEIWVREGNGSPAAESRADDGGKSENQLQDPINDNYVTQLIKVLTPQPRLLGNPVLNPIFSRMGPVYAKGANSIGSFETKYRVSDDIKMRTALIEMCQLDRIIFMGHLVLEVLKVWEETRSEAATVRWRFPYEDTVEGHRKYLRDCVVMTAEHYGKIAKAKSGSASSSTTAANTPIITMAKLSVPIISAPPTPKKGKKVDTDTVAPPQSSAPTTPIRWADVAMQPKPPGPGGYVKTPSLPASPTSARKPMNSASQPIPPALPQTQYTVLQRGAVVGDIQGAFASSPAKPPQKPEDFNPSIDPKGGKTDKSGVGPGKKPRHGYSLGDDVEYRKSEIIRIADPSSPVSKKGSNQGEAIPPPPPPPPPPAHNEEKEEEKDELTVKMGIADKVKARVLQRHFDNFGGPEMEDDRRMVRAWVMEMQKWFWREEGGGGVGVNFLEVSPPPPSPLTMFSGEAQAVKNEAVEEERLWNSKRKAHRGGKKNNPEWKQSGTRNEYLKRQEEFEAPRRRAVEKAMMDMGIWAVMKGALPAEEAGSMTKEQDAKKENWDRKGKGKEREEERKGG